jgi:prepilin-type N-terminal cleavage/methylation domain-containing protein
MKKLGFTLVEIMIVVAIIGLLAAIAIPSFVKARNQAQQNACINNLRMIDAGKEQAALELRLTQGDTVPTTAVDSYIKGNTTPVCPGGGSYTYNPIGTNPQCNITTPTSHRLPGSSG